MSLALDPVKNFAKVTVSTGYDDVATSIALSSGNGAKLPDPGTDGAFNLVWWNVTDYPDPSDDPNVEIVRVTARSTDTLTVTRAQEGTSASTKNTGGKTYKMILAFTLKTFTDIKDLKTSLTAGSILVSDGSNIVQDNADLFYDSTNKSLYVGTNSPAVTSEAQIYQYSTQSAVYHYAENATTRWRIQFGATSIVIGDGIGSPFAMDSGLGVGSFRLTSTGLGLGTTIPTTKLDVRGGISQQGGNVTFNAASEDRDFNVNSSGINNTLFVDGSSARVSIGANETNPATVLHIKQNDTVTVPTVEIEQHSTGDAGIQFTVPAASFAMGIDNSDGDKFKISYAATAGTAVLGTNDLLAIDPATGYLGVGTASPTGRLHVYEASANAFLIVQTGATNGEARFQFQNDAQTWLTGVNSNDHFVVIDSTTGPNTPFLIEAGSANNAIRIDSSGEVVVNEDGLDLNFRVEGDTLTHLLFVDAGTDRVGINTSSPQFPLHLDGGSGNIPFQIDSTGATTQFKLNGTGTCQFTNATTQGAGRTFQVTNNGSAATFKNATDNAGTFGIRNSSNSDILIVDLGGSHQAVYISSGSDLGIGVGTSPTTRLHVKDDDNTTVVTVEINATSANVTSADTFIDFRSSSGSIGSIAGTASSGVIAYNTFTGSHWSQSDTIHAVRREERVVEKKTIQKEDDHGVPYEEEVTEERDKVWYESDLQAGAVLISIDEMAEWDEEPESDYLPKTEVSTQKEDKRVYGVYGGHDKDGDIIVLALGAGRILVCDEGGPIEVGDFICSSSVPGHGMRYDGNDMRVVVAKARQSFIKGEGLIACTYLCG